MTIQKAIQLLCSSDDKYQAMGAYYLQHTCFQDESAKQEVSKPLQRSAVTHQTSTGPLDFHGGVSYVISGTQELIKWVIWLSVAACSQRQSGRDFNTGE